MSLDFVVKNDISDTKEVFCVDCKETFLKDAMWSVYAYGEKDDSTTFRGVCYKCRQLEITSPKTWVDMKERNQKRWDKKNA